MTAPECRSLDGSAARAPPRNSWDTCATAPPVGMAGAGAVRQRHSAFAALAARVGCCRALAALGIREAQSRLYHAQTCGKVERFHQTLKRYLRPPATPATTLDGYKRSATVRADLQASPNPKRSPANRCRRRMT